jgi:hypothetical protein
MADDPVSAYRKKLQGEAARPSPAAPPPMPTLPPSLVHAADTRQVYVAFENKVRATSVHIRNYQTGILHAVQYIHMSTIDFNFIRADWLAFSADGCGYRIEGRNLGDVMMALDLRACASIQDYHPRFFLPSDTLDTAAPFISRIHVTVLRPAPKEDAEEGHTKPKRT